MSFHGPMNREIMLKIRYKAILFIVLWLLLTPALSVAGNYIVSPVIVNLDSRAKTTVVKITNKDTQELMVKLSVKKWNQSETESTSYDDTKDIVFFPRMAKLAKGEEKIIRVGYQGVDTVDTEKAYRLLIEEIPVKKMDGMTIKVLLNISVPIYVSPLKRVKKYFIEKFEFSLGTIAVTVKNNGNTHFNVGNIKVVGIEKSGNLSFEKVVDGGSILAGAAGTFKMNLKKSDCMKTDKIISTFKIEDKSIKKELDLDKTQCVGGKDEEQSSDGQSTRRIPG